MIDEMDDAEVLEVVRRLRVALVEMGWSESDVFVWEGRPAFMPSVPNAICWQAAFVARTGHPLACFACFDADPYRQSFAERCAYGDCSHPDGPARPPRELLVSRGGSGA